MAQKAVLLLITLLNLNISQSTITFGFTKDATVRTSGSGHDSNVTLTLFWNTTIYQCIIFTDPSMFGVVSIETTTYINSNIVHSDPDELEETEFNCDTNPQIVGLNEKKEYKFKVYYDVIKLFRPTKFHVIDNGNIYVIDSFCGPIQYDYIDGLDNTDLLCTQYFANQNRYEYDYIEFGRNNPGITISYITFAPDFLSYPNILLPGSVSPAKIYSFSITTESRSFNEGLQLNPITLRLYWDIDLYICTLSHVNLADKTYTCDVLNTSQVITNCTDNQYISTDNNSLFALFMDKSEEYGGRSGIVVESISITDESGKTYELNYFCEPDLSEYSEGQIGVDQDSSDGCPIFGNNLTLYQNICIDPTVSLEFGSDKQCVEGNTIIGIQFSKDLFETYKSGSDQGLVYPVASLPSIICDGSTLSPSVSPIIDIPTEVPSADPTTNESTPANLTSVPTEALAAQNRSTIAPVPTPMYGVPAPSISDTATPDTSMPTEIKPSRPDPSIYSDTLSDSDSGGTVDTQGWIIIGLSSALVLTIFGIIIYCVYRRGINKGMKKAIASSSENSEQKPTVIMKGKQGETSNMNVLNGEHDEAPPVAYSGASVVSSDDEKEIEIALPKQITRGGTHSPTTPGRGEGNETVMYDAINENGNDHEDMYEDEDQGQDGSGPNETDNLMMDEKDQDEKEKNERSDDSDTMEMYENNVAPVIEIPEIPGSNPIDSALPKEEESLEKLKIKNVDSLDDLYEPEENETAGDQNIPQREDKNVTHRYQD